MLYKTNDGLVRAQGAWVGKGEMDRIMGFVVKQWPSLIDASVVGEIEKENEDLGSSGDGDDGIDDEKYERAKRIVIDANRASISLVQRELHIGYNPASRIIDRMEKEGIVGPARGAGPREILVSTC